MWVWSLGQEDSPGVGNGNSLQYSFLENSMDRGAWQATVHGIAKSQTWLSDWACTRTHTHVFIRNWRFVAILHQVSPLVLFFPTAFAHFITLCHILVILNILKYFPLLYLLWWSVTRDFWCYYYNLWKVQKMVGIFWSESCSVMCDSAIPWTIAYLPGSSVHGVFQARVLEWVAISFSRGSNSSLPHCRQTLYPLSHKYFKIKICTFFWHKANAHLTDYSINNNKKIFFSCSVLLVES